VLEEFINTQMFVHCRAIESLSQLALQVGTLDPDAEAEVRAPCSADAAASSSSS
jgi:hypothetical protein